MMMFRAVAVIVAVHLVHADDCDLSTDVPWPQASGLTTCQPFNEAYLDTYAWLLANMPQFDSPNTETLFVDGVASTGVTIGLKTRQNDASFPWAKTVPRSIFLDYVAPYANVNEARVNWRALLQPAMAAVFSKVGDIDGSIFQAQGVVNGYANASHSVWTALSSSPIVFKSEQTPVIYDPMSTIAFSYASCTGISILFIDALRSVGIPARLVGTPAWNGDRSNGNHNWVEIWRPTSGSTEDAKGGQWSPIEGKPAGGGESLDDPCTLWFCNPSHFPPDTGSSTATPVFAATFNQTSPVRYPMAWDLQNKDIPGEDLSQVYAGMCGKC